MFGKFHPPAPNQEKKKIQRLASPSSSLPPHFARCSGLAGQRGRGWGARRGGSPPPDGAGLAGVELRYEASPPLLPRPPRLAPPPNVLLGGGSWTWPRLWWPSALSHYSLTTHNSYQLKKINQCIQKNKQTLYTVCFRHCKARQQPTSSGFLFSFSFFWVFYMHIYIYEYEYNVRMCMNVVVFSFF